MAYQVKRKKQYTEDFELTEEDGTVVHTLHVALDPDGMVGNLSKKYVELNRAMQDVKNSLACEDPEKMLQVVADAVKDLLEAVFGADDAQTILEFYANRYIELCSEVLPFVADVVIPEVRKMAKDNKVSVIGKYNRKSRRLFGKK